MLSWARTLDAAGIDAVHRADYEEQRRIVARFARAEYAAVRLLLPARIVPDVIAAVAFMHVTDDLIDQGDSEQRITALAHWESQVRQAIETRSADQPVLRALLYSTTRHPQLSENIEQFLRGAHVEARWQGFATESEQQRYIDTYSLPAFMLTACLLTDRTPSAAYVESCRSLIEAMQRLDWVEDLAEDLAQDRLGVPAEVLGRHGLRAHDLRATVGQEKEVAELVREQTGQADRLLAAARSLEDGVALDLRPFVRALIEVEVLRTRAVAKRGEALRRGPSKLPVVGALRILGREYRAGRHAA
ncbi:squalene/phytoene synthase family protein [Streptomyces phyllanthi]|uniref:Phytoene/squalene synthetase n=1 Tax=Streptomyces phyllanthi TaxID=1803180 RepID=A0A5N8VY30_9ACTN|nr:squalene/phytoene synthase family protein [Streptomyces phyllanthi]MPY39004.1 phytoene/squalene synthetase [Streptomyces phyllanthi]